jgi:hypothetical protein
MEQHPVYGFFKCRFLLAAIVAIIYIGNPYSMPGDVEADYERLEDYGDEEWDTLWDMIEEAKELCCRKDSREIRAIGKGEPDSMASWSQNPEFTVKYKELQQLIDMQKLVAPLHAIFKSGQAVGGMSMATVGEMAEAITCQL